MAQKLFYDQYFSRKFEHARLKWIALHYYETQYLFLLPPPFTKLCRNLEEGALAGTCEQEEYKKIRSIEA